MQEKLEQRVAEWLKTQGYPLEMKVASAFRKEAFFVSQSSYYSDPETATSREIEDNLGLIFCESGRRLWRKLKKLGKLEN